MPESAPTVASYRRHGLYYPYFHVRDERWLKVAALYWPKIVRIVPDDYQTNDSETVRALSAHDFIIRRPPGSSVEAVTPRFIDLVTDHAEELRSRFRVTPRKTSSTPIPLWNDDLASGLLGESEFPMRIRSTPSPDAPLTNITMPLRNITMLGSSASGRTTFLAAGLHASLWEESSKTWLTAVHVSQMSSRLRDALVDAELAGYGVRKADFAWATSSIDGSPFRHLDPRKGQRQNEADQWILMHQQLVNMYTSVLAEDFALANHLQPTTDQDDAYAVTNNWTADRIAAFLLDSPRAPAYTSSPDELPEALGFLALEMVVPPDLDNVPINKIIEIRERCSSEFSAFGQAVDEAACALAELSDVRDKSILEDYLRQAIEDRFTQPLDELRGKMRRLAGDTAMMSINIKAQLPAAAAIAGGAWLAGQPLLAGISGMALGLIGIRREVLRQRETALKSDPAVSFLLHTDDKLKPEPLLRRTLKRFERI